MRIVYGKAVFEELVNISFYIAQDNDETAQRFLDPCNGVSEFLAKNTMVGVPSCICS